MQTVDEIKLLLLKNKLRLYQELYESKEALFLLRKSTRTPLNEQEKLKVRVQLLDICKAILSLVVFMLPGGALLLPLLIKLLPDILPSAFRDEQ